MASRGRGRKSPPQSGGSSPGGMQMSPIPSLDPVGEAASADFIEAPLKMAPRPGFGTKGRPIPLITNHFHMTMPKTAELYTYDIEILQERDSKKIVWTNGKAFGLPRYEIRDKCYSIYLEYVKTCGLNLYELIYNRQKTLYSLKDLKELGHMKSIVVTMGTETFTVIVSACNPPTVVISPETIARAAVDTSNNTKDRSPLQILDLITNQFLFYMHAIKETEYIHFGRYFYKPKYLGNEYHYLEFGGRQVYEGFFKSLRLILGPNPTSGIPYLSLNVDSKKAPFFTQQPLIDTVWSTLSLPDNHNCSLTDQQVRTLNLHMKEIRVRTLHTKKTFMMSSFTSVPAKVQTFKGENGQDICVFDYFKTKYNHRMKYGHLPCVRKRGGGRGTNRTDWTYFPIEMCEVVAHQKVDLKKTDETQSRELIKVSAVPPEQRLRDIKTKAKDLDSSENNQVDLFSKTFGISRNPEPMKFNGRQLETPKILFNPQGPNNTANVANGQWRLQGQVHLPSEIGPFAVCCLDQRITGNFIDKFTKNLIDTARNMGINMSKNFLGDYCKESTIDSVFRKLSLEKKINFFICIMDDTSKGDRLKNAVKLAEVKYTIITQCVRPKTIKKCADNPHDEIYKNLALKINLKNGGINNEIDLQNDPVSEKWLRPGVMFVGMDVNHPPPLSKAEIAQGFLPKEPSVVGAVANCGKSVSDYRMRYYLQDARQEEVMAVHLKDMVTDFVEEYASNWKKRPESIVWFRDGVSESQFKMVIDNETIAVKQAFACMNPPYNPKLTVITVQKRHNTRFFQEMLTKMSPDKLRSMKNVEKNVPAGTVVDIGPVSAHLFDFYLCSHVGLQGTSKPTYYVVLLDENGFLPDELQRLTFVLCHQYQRCTKSVSLPAPVYHAHHVATRGKGNFLADNEGADDSSSGISSASSEGSSTRGARHINYEAQQSRIQYGPLGRDRMFWA